MSLVIIDLDGTLLEGLLSSEKLFYRYLLRNGMIGLRQFNAYVFFYLRWFKIYGRMTSKKNKSYLTELKVSHIERCADRFVKTQLVDCLCGEVKRRIEKHHDQEDVTVLVTGSLEMIARPVCAFLGINHIRATECATSNGHFTNLPPRVHPFGKDKVRVSREIGNWLGLDLADATAYGNDIYDVELLEEVANPIAVHPDRALRKHALACSWEIIDSCQ